MSRLGLPFCKRGTLIFLTSQKAELTGQPNYSTLSLLRGALVSGLDPYDCHIVPHSERSGVPPSSWQPHIEGKLGALLCSIPELRSQPTQCCGMFGKFPTLSVLCPVPTEMEAAWGQSAVGRLESGPGFGMCWACG